MKNTVGLCMSRETGKVVFTLFGKPTCEILDNGERKYF